METGTTMNGQTGIGIKITFKTGVEMVIRDVIEYTVTGGDLTIIKGATSTICDVTFREHDTYVKNPRILTIKGDVNMSCDMDDVLYEDLVR